VQDCLALLTELRQLRDREVYNAVEVVLSGERWSPIAAVLLKGCRLPEVIQPEQSDLRIPIPDLYGFATSASAVLFPSTLGEADEQGEVRPVPFCEDLGPENLPPNRPYFSDLRAHGEQTRGHGVPLLKSHLVPHRMVSTTRPCPPSCSMYWISWNDLTHWWRTSWIIVKNDGPSRAIPGG
jgi:hypothetical protein